jgi:hypothetical protein
MSSECYSKTIVCFANSRKTGGRCVAGKEWLDGTPGDWIRPISHRPSHELSLRECRYQSGKAPGLLDIVDIEFDCHQPAIHQEENHRIDPEYYWQNQGQLKWDKLHDWVDNPRTLWTIGESSYSGCNNRISLDSADGCSLYLINVDNLRLLVGKKAPEFPDSKRAVRCSFHFRNIYYQMDVTDLVIERHYLAKRDGEYVVNNPVLCISLGDEYQGYYYKLVAAIMFEERFK